MASFIPGGVRPALRGPAHPGPAERPALHAAPSLAGPRGGGQ